MGSVMIIERAELGEVTAAATKVTNDGTGPSHQHRALCGDMGHTRLKSLYLSNVSYTCDYPGSRQNISIDSKVIICIESKFSVQIRPNQSRHERFLRLRQTKQIP